MVDMLIVSALVFLAIAIFTTIVGVYASPSAAHAAGHVADQGADALLFWLAGASLVIAMGLLLTHLGLFKTQQI